MALIGEELSLVTCLRPRSLTCLSEDRWRMMFLSPAGHGTRYTAGQETGSAKSGQQLETVKGFSNVGYSK